jgi:hypothetical protein
MPDPAAARSILGAAADELRADLGYRLDSTAAAALAELFEYVARYCPDRDLGGVITCQILRVAEGIVVDGDDHE